MEVLIVDDESAILDWLSATVRPLGLTPVTAKSGAVALELLRTRDIGFVMTDFMMPGMNGAELLRTIRESNMVLPVVVMSGVGSVEDAMSLLRLGADDFLSKPMKRDVLLPRLQQIIQKARIYEEARLFRRYVEAGDQAVDGILTRSTVMLKVLQRLPQIARSDATTLILGQSGTGKELFAAALHKLSKRADKPYVPVNCGALPETLVESTLFGHRKGAFTGADRDNPGLARSAEGGTLFLDEIGDLPLNAQVKLLRFLQTKELTPLGDSKPVQVDVRIVAATHRDLKKAIAEGKFREDLYYRLNVISLEIPPLDDRPEDIPLLAAHFLKKFAPEYGSPARAFSPEALAALVSRSWSGNVRELENVVQRAIVASDGPIIHTPHLQLSPAPLGPPMHEHATAGVPVRAMEGSSMATETHAQGDSEDVRPFQTAKKAAVDGFERDYLLNLLKRAPRMTDAAELAGIDRKGLWRLLKKHGMRSKDTASLEAELIAAGESVADE